MFDPNHLIRHAELFLTQVFSLAVWLVLLIAIFVPLERLFGLRPIKFFRKQVGVDLAWYFINSILPAAVIVVPLSLLAQALHHINPGGYYSMVAGWHLWIRLPLMFLVNDLGAYWYHRASHHVPVLWQFHAIHHSSEDLDWLVNTRAHPVDMVFGKLAGLVPVYLLGLGQTVGGHLDKGVALLVILGTIWSFFIHANIKWRLGPLEWLISTPAFHHWHHTNDEHRDRNFAAIFPLYDSVFGTAWLPKHWPPVYGIDAKVPPTLVGQLVKPLPNPSPASPTMAEQVSQK